MAVIPSRPPSSAVLDPPSCYCFDFRHEAVIAGELTALQRPPHKLAFPFRHRVANEQSIPMPALGLTASKRQVARITVDPILSILSHALAKA